MTHKMMLEDAVRTIAYADAIAATVRPEHRVVDFGSGTGVLAVFAARQHPKRVDAIERTSMVHFARQIAARSGCAEIVFHHGDHTTFQTDGPVDVIVSEWMGHCVFHEAMLEPLIQLRDRWLKPGGQMIPKRISLHVGLVVDSAVHEGDTFLHGAPYGVDFSAIAELPARQTGLVTLARDQLLKTDCNLATLDLETLSAVPESFTGEMVADKAARVYGLLGWFSAELSPGITLGTGPDDPLTHWRHMYFPLPEPMDVEPGTRLELSLRPPQLADAPEPGWVWSVTIAGRTQTIDERETFRRCARGM
jgi:precorrin-6B methylase 2